MTASIQWVADGQSSGVGMLTRDLAAAPAAVRAQLRPALRTIGQRVLADARGRASWSTRIPAAMSLRVRLAGDRPGVIITVSTAKAPHARPYEGLIAASFRHPVFGDRQTWVTQAARPYLWPAAAAAAPGVEREARDALDAALRKHDL